jgi:hypothetical protein
MKFKPGNQKEIVRLKDPGVDGNNKQYATMWKLEPPHHYSI